ncbi:hypothetical protein M426DRAFT_257448 [Hypoxylon sp. CI-4A]|nr:hypothetical protein M426DRAFT_257448 [Hypoxylon sp. CI-4A]
MAAPFPSIQSFYSRELPPGSQEENTGPSDQVKPGDGFTSSEIETAVNPLSRPWKPSRHYEACAISLLETGPHNYKISGRIVNFTIDHKDLGHHFLVVTDGTRAIAVRLYYIKASDYQLLFGQRVTIWTAFIVDPSASDSGNIPFCTAATNLYPGRNIATHVVIHDDVPGSDSDSILRCPLECNLTDYEYLPNLMTLKAFLASGYDAGSGKILVCVRSVGPRRTLTSKKHQTTFDMVEVGIFDDTETCTLKLWGDKIRSAKSWVPNQTILLISKPTHQIRASSSELGIGTNSMIDVNPIFPDVDWLRKKVKNMTKERRVHVSFPSSTWDTEIAMHGPGRTLFTIAEIEDQVRHPESVIDFTGKLYVMINEMKLMENWRKGTLCCVECCGVPVYANRSIAICKNCDSVKQLALNPRVIGSMIDESGMITGGKLVWRDEAWTQLFSESRAAESMVEGKEVDLVEELIVVGINVLKGMEETLLYSHVTLTFGWSSELERLCIMGAEW